MVRPKISNTQSNDDPLKKKPLEDLLKKREVKRASVADMLKGGAKKALAPKDFSGRYGYQSSGAAETQGGQVDIDTGEAKTGTQNTPSESKAPITAGFASKPQYKLPGPDGQLGTDDDEINPEYAPSRSKSILTGMSLAGQLAQGKSQSIYYRLGAALAGGVAGILNPELAGQQEYEKDLAKHYAETEATYKLQKMEEENRLRDARRQNIEARTAAVRAKDAEKDLTRRAMASRSVASLLYTQSKSGTLTQEEMPEFTARAKNELAEILMSSTGMDRADAESEVASMSLDRVMEKLGNWAVDPKSRAYKANNGRWYRNSVDGTPLEVTDASGNTFVEAYDQNRIMAQAIKFEDDAVTKAVSEIPAEDRAELYKKAMEIADRANMLKTSSAKSSNLSPQSAYIVKSMYESLLVERAKEKNPGLKGFQYSFTFPDGTIVTSSRVKGEANRPDPSTQPVGPVRSVSTAENIRQANVGTAQIDVFDALTSETSPFSTPPPNTVNPEEWQSIQNSVRADYVLSGDLGSSTYQESIKERRQDVAQELGTLNAKRNKTSADRARIKALQIMSKRFNDLEEKMYAPVAAPTANLANLTPTTFMKNYNRLRERAAFGMNTSEELARYDQTAREEIGEKPLDLRWSNPSGSSFSVFSDEPEWSMTSVGNGLGWSSEITNQNLINALNKDYTTNKNKYPLNTFVNISDTVPNARLARREVKDEAGNIINTYTIVYSKRFK